MARVRLEQITRKIESNLVIDTISFEVPDGSFWVLVGPSGCGKSTLLRMIAGLEQPTSGALYIGDRLVNQIPARQRDVAMVFQNYALYPHMTVAENLAFGLKMRGSDRTAIASQVTAVAESLSIDHLLDRKPAQLSGGQQQRVALGRAIARKPQVFLLDEPLSNLDAQLRDETRAELKRLHQRLGITTLYVTHDQVEAMTLADHIVVLNQGRVQQMGDPQAIYAHPANQMVATFLGNPPMNILAAEWSGDEFRIGGYQIPRPADWEPKLPAGTRVNLGIRPEHLAVVSSSAEAHLQVTVTLVEPLGREILLRAVLDSEAAKDGSETALNLQVPPNIRPHMGDRLWLKADLTQLHAFDPKTGERWEK